MGYAYLNKNDYYSAIQSLDKAINMNSNLGKEIKSVIDSIKNSIENLEKGLLEKFNNK